MCRKKINRKRLAILLIVFQSFIATMKTAAQSGVAGIEKATELMNDYFNAGTTLLYIIGAVVGLIGAIKVYNKWSSGDQDTSKAAASWFGACIFLVIVATALKSFFAIK